MLCTVETPLGQVTARVRPGSTGEAPPWVLLHGAAGSWRTFIELLNSKAVPQGRDLVVIDLPGWGDSPGSLPFTVEEQGEAVIQVLHALGYRRWRLLGHSMGGVLALEIAARAPQDTLAVVVLSPTAVTAAAALGQPLRHLRMAPLYGMYLLMRFLKATGRYAPKLLSFALHTGLLRLILRPFFTRPSRVPERVFRDLAADARPASFLAAAEALRQYDVARWRAIAAATLLARGEKDVFTPAGELHELAALIPHAHCIVLPGAGHFAQLEHPDETALLLASLDFLTQSLDRPD